MGDIAHAVVLTLAELSSAASAVKTWLLAFLHAGIASQEAVVTQRLEVLFAQSAQGAGDTHANRARLACQPTATDADKHVHAVRLANMSECLQYILLVLVGREEDFEWFAVNDDLAGAWAEAYACHSGLAAAGTQTISVNFVFFKGYHGVLEILVICVDAVGCAVISWSMYYLEYATGR